MGRNHSEPLFSYRPGTSFVHRCPTGVKLLLCALTAPFTFMLPPAALSFLTLSLLALAAIAGVRLKSVLRIFLFIFYYALFIYLIQYAGQSLRTPLTQESLRSSGLYLAQMFTVFVSGTLFYETTSSAELRGLLEFPYRLLEKKCPPSGRRFIPAWLRDIPLLFSLMVSFIPRIFQHWNDLSTAWEARSAGKKGLFQTVRRLSILIPALIMTLLERAADTDRALRNRSF